MVKMMTKIDIGPRADILKLTERAKDGLRLVLRSRFQFFLEHVKTTAVVIEGKPLKGCPRTKYLSTKFKLPQSEYAAKAQPFVEESLMFLADQVSEMPSPIEFYVMPPEENCHSYFVWENEEVCLRQFDRVVEDDHIETHFDLVVRFADEMP